MTDVRETLLLQGGSAGSTGEVRRQPDRGEPAPEGMPDVLVSRLRVVASDQSQGQGMTPDHKAVAAVKQRFTRWAGWPAPMKPFQSHWCDVDALAAHVVGLEGPQLRQRVTQTRLHSETVNGNCTSACLASVFGGTCEDYHDRIALDGNWWSDVEKIFAERGYMVLRLSPADGVPKGIAFAAGDSPRGVRHLCVAMDGEVVWDPHPSRAGLVEITDYWVMIPWRFA